jgi:mannose-6-phosphate isomerase
MLTYTSKSADQQIMPPIPFKSSKYTTLYDPPIEEFSVLLTDLPAGEKEVQLHVDGPSIFIITRGNGEISWDGGEKKVRLEREGVVFFVGADTSVEFTAGIEGLVVYRAFVESPGTS